MSTLFFLKQQLNCPWLLVANIDCGGVFAQVIGTKACLPSSDWELCAGIIINKLRGELKYFEPGPNMIKVSYQCNFRFLFFCLFSSSLNY